MKLKVDNYIKYYDNGKKGSKSFIVDINPGYTCLVGPNGTGKTTMMKQIKDFCRENYNEYILVKYDNVHEGGSHRFQEYLESSQIDMITSIVTSSEGEGIIIHLGDFAHKCGQATQRAKAENKKLVILIDGVDSGTSIDKIIDFRNYFCKTIIDFCQKEEVEVYIIATANTYAMIEDGVDCIVSFNGRHRQFKGYNSYKSFILKNAKEQ